MTKLPKMLSSHINFFCVKLNSSRENVLCKCIWINLISRKGNNKHTVFLKTDLFSVVSYIKKYLYDQMEVEPIGMKRIFSVLVCYKVPILLVRLVLF